MRSLYILAPKHCQKENTDMAEKAWPTLAEAEARMQAERVIGEPALEAAYGTVSHLGLDDIDREFLERRDQNQERMPLGRAQLPGYLGLLALMDLDLSLLEKHGPEYFGPPPQRRFMYEAKK